MPWPGVPASAEVTVPAIFALPPSPAEKASAGSAPSHGLRSSPRSGEGTLERAPRPARNREPLPWANVGVGSGARRTCEDGISGAYDADAPEVNERSITSSGASAAHARCSTRDELFAVAPCSALGGKPFIPLPPFSPSATTTVVAQARRIQQPGSRVRDCRA